MRGKKAKVIRRLWRKNLTEKHADMIGVVLKMPSGQVMKPERMAYQAMKGRRFQVHA